MRKLRVDQETLKLTNYQAAALENAFTAPERIPPSQAMILDMPIGKVTVLVSVNY